MDPLTNALIAGGIQAGTGLFQTISGARQRRRARKDLGRLEDPTMEMPSSITQMIELARLRAGSEMPGLSTARDELGARTSRGVEAVSRAARTPGDITAATRDLYAEEMRGIRQLETSGAEYRAARERELMGAYGTQGEYQQRMFDVNVMLPYQRRLQQYMTDAQTGGQNIAHGIGTMGAAGTDFLSNYYRLKMLQGWMGGEGAEGDPKASWMSESMGRISDRGLDTQHRPIETWKLRSTPSPWG